MASFVLSVINSLTNCMALMYLVIWVFQLKKML